MTDIFKVTSWRAVIGGKLGMTHLNARVSIEKLSETSGRMQNWGLI